MAFIDMTGWVMSEHGVPDSLITILERANDHIDQRGNKRVQWLCQCSCGSNPFVSCGTNIRNGTTKSCGCIKNKKAAERFKNRHKINNYDLCGEYGIGWTLNTNKEFYFDLEDYDKIKDYCWFETNTGYIQANIKNGNKVDGRGFIKLHRLITNNQFKYVDHKNRNKADNRKENLRKCSRSQNGMNRDIYSNNKTGVTGVYYRKDNGKYSALIKDNGRQICIGTFTNKEDAIKARLKAEIQYYGEFAPQKHLFEEYGIISS